MAATFCSNNCRRTTSFFSWTRLLSSVDEYSSVRQRRERTAAWTEVDKVQPSDDSTASQAMLSWSSIWSLSLSDPRSRQTEISKASQRGLLFCRKSCVRRLNMPAFIPTSPSREQNSTKRATMDGFVSFKSAQGNRQLSLESATSKEEV